jgi:hypothetical protein
MLTQAANRLQMLRTLPVLPLYRSTKDAQHSLSNVFVACIRSYLFAFGNVFALGLYTSTIGALISHKIMIILLHSPLATLSLIFAFPFLFVFDVITVVIIYRGLSSKRFLWRALSGWWAFVICCCSAAFASLYIEGNTEMDWSRSIMVLFAFVSTHG